VFSKGTPGVELLLFDREDDPRPSRVVPLQRAYHYWHTLVPGLKAGQIYAYRVQGTDHVLLDPYARALAMPRGYDRFKPSVATSMKSLVADLSRYDWGQDAPPRHPFPRTVIYEMHVGGFTRHPNSGLPDFLRGTYAGLIEKIPYLQRLGVTAVELLPVFAFDPQDAPKGRRNYWGYAPVSFFAPHPHYSSHKDPLRTLDEFRDMVRALHGAGIEVILDVVYNHTAEGDDEGAIFCFKALANSVYYLLQDGRYANYSGTGNSLNANQSVVRRLILDSLRFWVREMHVDGFRFDLASLLSRDQDGHPMKNPPVLWDIESDPVMAGTKLIAEAWDAAGLYQVGSFVGDAWKEWNGRFRDDVRSFFRGDEGTVEVMAQRLLASPDLYAHEEREPEQSINFVTCHDGFTLNDLVTYSRKYNEANGENNRDGSTDNRSWNCGVEGPTDDPAVERLRNRMVKNFLTVTLLSLGTPMLTMGDEVRRTQQGNNNAYCQDNQISWFDWSLLDKHADVLRFTRILVRSRVGRSLDLEQDDLTLNQLLEHAPVQWHGTHLNQPDWSWPSHSLAFVTHLPGREMYVILNAFWEPLEFQLPPGKWRRWVDTSLDSPNDVTSWERAVQVDGSRYKAESRSVVVLIS
ncbi:MAG: glycogen debranching protein GlgX, partial [Candidatus Eremiobacterota bacterium]